MKKGDLYYCDFCGRSSEGQGYTMIVGKVNKTAHDAAMCSECVKDSVAILARSKTNDRKIKVINGGS